MKNISALLLVLVLPVSVLAQSGATSGSNAASLASPATLCKLITASSEEGNTHPAEWKGSNDGYSCITTGVILPSEGAVMMTGYNAAGSTKERASLVYFKIDIYDSVLRKDQIAAQILSRLSAVFKASKAGAVPDEAVKAIRDVTTASVSTNLGLLRTRFTPGTDTPSPSNGAKFEMELDAPEAK